MAKYTCDFKHKIYCNVYIYIYVYSNKVKPGQAVYFAFSRGLFRTFSTSKQRGYLIGGNYFPKNFTLDVWKGSECVVAW